MKTKTVFSTFVIITALIPVIYFVSQLDFSTSHVDVQAKSNENTAILVLDIQKDFFDDNGKLPIEKTLINPILSNVNAIINKMEGSDKHSIIYVANEYQNIQFLLNRGRNFAAMKGTPGAELDGRLKIVSDNFISKNKPSAFSNPLFQETLVQNNTGSLVIVGVYAEACVADTAKDALKRGYSVILIEDAIGSGSEIERDKALEALANQGAIIMTATEYINSIAN
ncbi:cysteine hydrolase [Bacillus sp. HMF5848]|uniref:cysteine hydrolase family protein n=1 Tax=Bacillus sp. HMF5848 TaxID=2495421 RepID=UPI000F7A2426|nr:cysteine hydrolase [Bacillus sp. HMF5848]RSK25847.1 cysteine hydrolase [Bacillus sp. HMF5848]